MMSRYRDAPLADLVEASRSPLAPGHEDAFGEIVRRFRGHALAAAFRLLRDAHLAQDVAQEAFLDAFLGLEKLRDPAAFPGWFRRIVIKHADRARRRLPLPLRQLDSEEPAPDEGMSPEAWAIARESIVRVREVVAELPEHERVVVALFYFAHRSHVEIGERMALPVSTVKKRLHDARRRLRIPLEASETPFANGVDSKGAEHVDHAHPDLRGDEVRLPVPALHSLPLVGAEALRLAAMDSPDARAVLRRFEPEQVAAALLELSADDQMSFLEASERLPEIVPCLPELHLTQTIRRVGLDEAGWVLEFASPEQRVAALDLDCWRDERLSPTRVFEWIDALIEAGTETLLAAFDELDTELWILALQWMAEFSIPGQGAGAEPDPWEDDDVVVDLGTTDDGVVFYLPVSGDHEERIHAILNTARIYVPSLYWDFVRGAVDDR